jgi:hypothetical protein
VKVGGRTTVVTRAGDRALVAGPAASMRAPEVLEFITMSVDRSEQSR